MLQKNLQLKDKRFPWMKIFLGEPAITKGIGDLDLTWVKTEKWL